VLPDCGDFGFSVLLEVLSEPSRSHPVSRSVAAVTAARNENHFRTTMTYTKFLEKKMENIWYVIVLRTSSEDYVAKAVLC